MLINDKFDSGVPIYLQIMHLIRRKIASGEWPPGHRVPAVRELALKFGVNPNTMQRALSELEREGPAAQRAHRRTLYNREYRTD